MKQKVYDYLGNEVGELEFPDGTDPDLVAAKVAKYAEAPKKVFQAITAVQIRKALVAQGFTLEQIDGGLNSLTEPMRSSVLIDWQYLEKIPREHALADTVALLLGWKPEQVDALWIQAATL